MREFISIVETYIDEVFNFGKFPEANVDVATLSSRLLNGASKLKEVQSDIFLYQNSGYYFLYDQGSSTLVGFVKMSNTKVIGKEYSQLDLIYVTPAFRRTNAKRLLLYVIKEETDHPVIADGVIFKDGQKVLTDLLTNPILHVKILNKVTGDISPFTQLVNDPDLCYLLKETNLGYGKQYLPEGCPFTWFPIIDND